jgi:hypothetical protein
MRLALGMAAALFVSGCNCGKGQPGSGTLCGDFSPVLSSACGFIDRCPNAFPYPIGYRSRAECTDILCFSLTCRLNADLVNGTPTFSLMQSIPKVDSAKVQACSNVPGAVRAGAELHVGHQRLCERAVRQSKLRVREPAVARCRLLGVSHRRVHDRVLLQPR